MKLERGINIGGYLSQCKHETSHYRDWIDASDINRIAAWGFDHVRLPIDYEVLQDKDGIQRPEGYAFVERVIGWCTDAGLNIVLDLHKTYGYDFNDAGDSDRNSLFTSDKLQRRFVELWHDIAIHFSKYSNVAFELLNEVVESENAEPWNKLIAEAVSAIREVTFDTVIIYGGIQWNSASTLCLLNKPADSNTIFTFHFYEPLLFTHQKAKWVMNMDLEREVAYPDDKAYYVRESNTLGGQGETLMRAKAQTIGADLIRELVKPAVDAAKKAGVSLYCGEFGVIDEAPVDDTLRWFKDVHKVFSEEGIGFALWSYKEMNFGLEGKHYDAIRNELISLWNGKA